MGMNPQQVQEFMQIQALLGDAKAGEFRQNIQVQKQAAFNRANPDKQTRWAAEDRGHLAFRRLPNVSNFSNSIATYNDMLVQANDPSGQSDLAMIIGTAKIFDPPGVVREGEVALQRGAGGLKSWVQGWAGFFASGHRLTRADRANLLRITHSRITQYRLAAEKNANAARATAKRRGLNPDNVVRNQFGADQVAPRILEKDIHPDVVDMLDVTGNEGKPSVFPRAKATPRAQRTLVPQASEGNRAKEFLDTLRQVQ